MFVYSFEETRYNSMCLHTKWLLIVMFLGSFTNIIHIHMHHIYNDKFIKQKST